MLYVNYLSVKLEKIKIERTHFEKCHLVNSLIQNLESSSAAWMYH